MPPRITRLAPSPTGALHLGNARTFLINWLLARQQRMKIVLRIEDIDGPRIKRNADRDLIADLQWLGIDWDEGPVYQSDRLERYKSAEQRLLESGLAYPCICSRREVELAASAPHAEDGSAIYPGTCRGKYGSPQVAKDVTGRPAAIRFQMPAGIIAFEDDFMGPRKVDAANELGDFVIAKADGTPAYQLAVVVDDAEMGITDVVRGNDLLDSTPRQILLYRALGLEQRIPSYIHLPLVVGTDGRRLAKRHGDTRLSYYRGRGVGPGRVLALMARWCGIRPVGSLEKASDLLDSFNLASVPRNSIIFHAEDDRWLVQGNA